MLAASAASLLALGATGPADNGRAIRPPQGWRHWNQWNGAISQEIIEGNIKGLADRSRLIDGAHASLADIGYSDAGIDDGWMKCGDYGPEKYRYHSELGNPVIDGGKFPDLSHLTDLAHSLNLTAGCGRLYYNMRYGNACGCAAQPYPQCCSDHCDTVECFAGDVNATLAYGFDSYKLDGCGAQRDIELWATMFNHSITLRRASNTSVRAQPLGMMIENCHDDDGWTRGNEPYYMNTTGELWCPFHTYRTSGDARPTYGSLMNNLNSTRRLAEANLSADMMEVGVTAGTASHQTVPDDELRINNDGICIRNDGFCIRNDGFCVQNDEFRKGADAMHDCGENGTDICQPLTVAEARTHFGAWAIVSSPLVLGFDLRDKNMTDLHWDTITNTDAIQVNQDYSGHSGSMFAQSTEMVTLHACDWKAGVSEQWPSSMSWYKPLSGRDLRGATIAVLLMNNGYEPAKLSFKFSELPGLDDATSKCTLYDVWGKKAIGAVSGSGYTTGEAVGSRDSVFVTLAGCK